MIVRERVEVNLEDLTEMTDDIKIMFLEDWLENPPLRYTMVKNVLLSRPYDEEQICRECNKLIFSFLLQQEYQYIHLKDSCLSASPIQILILLGKQIIKHYYKLNPRLARKRLTFYHHPLKRNKHISFFSISESKLKILRPICDYVQLFNRCYNSHTRWQMGFSPFIAERIFGDFSQYKGFRQEFHRIVYSILFYYSDKILMCKYLANKMKVGDMGGKERILHPEPVSLYKICTELLYAIYLFHQPAFSLDKLFLL